MRTIDTDARLDLWEQWWDFYIDEAMEIALYWMDQVMAINSEFEWTPRVDGWMTFRGLKVKK